MNTSTPLAALFALAAALQAGAFEPMTLFREQFIGPNFFAAFVPPNATQWVRVEFSTDLANWSERAQAISTRAHLFAEPAAKSIPRGFYRLAVPATSLDQARLRWEALGLRHYRFRFSTIPTGTVAPTGILTVASGQKSLSEVRDAITGQPLESFDPSAIPDIDELFSVIAQHTVGDNMDCRLVYDLQLNFPRETVFYLNFPPVWRSFSITEFAILTGSTANP